MKKHFLVFVFVLAVSLSLLGCGKATPLTIWVGAESVDFYTAKMTEYITNYNASHTEAFPYEVSVLGVDTGTAASTFLDDTEAGADLFTVAHDNLGKLISGSSAIAPITSQALLAQIAADNPQSFLDVIKGTVGGVQYTFGVPYIAQSLVLYYNSSLLTPEDVQTWEGIHAVAQEHNVQSVSLLGDDGFNNSFLLLARNAETLQTSLRLYEGGDVTDCNAHGDDIVSILRWGQWFFTVTNGARFPSSSGWEVELNTGASLSLIGGAWNFTAAQAALGTNLGITTLPSFTITADQAYGTIAAGTEYYSGSFTDCKMFVMKKGSEKAAYLEDILMFLTSVEVQEQSFDECQNLPSYVNAATEFAGMTADTIQAKLASAQIGMFTHGEPQPFGFSSKLNFYYYSKGAPALFREILENKEGAFTTPEAILAQIAIIEEIWVTGASGASS